MADLQLQLRSYVEATIERVDVEDVLAVREIVERPLWKHPVWRRPVVVALISAAAAAILVGGVVFLTRWLGQPGPVATTTTTTTSTTTLPPTTTTTLPPTTTTTTTPGLPPDAAAAWAAFDAVLPVEPMPPFLGGGHVVNDVAASDSMIVAVGDATNSDENAMRSGLVWVSADGLTWERVDDPEDLEYGGKGLNTVVAGGPGFVMAGTSCDFEERCTTGWRAALWTSVDGRDWQRVPHDPALFGERSAIYRLLAHGDEILAVGLVAEEDSFPTVVWSSRDGLTWERIYASDAAWPSILAEGPVGLVGVGSEGADTGSWAAVWTSQDGREWERVPHDPEVFGAGEGIYEGMASIAYGAAGFVAVGGDGNNAAVWVSPDGRAWERIPYDPAVFEGTSMTTVIAWRGGYLAAGPDWAMGEDLGGPYPGMASVPSRPTLWVSPDGRTWHRLPFGPEDAVGAVRALEEFRGMLVAVGQDGPFVTAEGEWGRDVVWVNLQPPELPGD
jgi:hypothetical protein